MHDSGNRLYQRFTPTRVGNTWNRKELRVLFPVHPHARGEYGASTSTLVCVAGSPPRAWGIRAIHDLGSARERFTPTRVGNTAPVPRLPAAISVHPHARGEYGEAVVRQFDLAGSPPRAWGIRNRRTRQHFALRFTPTRVGNTLGHAKNRGGAAVHPHARGEYDQQVGHDAERDGSPPRAWGIRTASRPCVLRNTVHPHARGEYVSPLHLRAPAPGSPPRAWGILLMITSVLAFERAEVHPCLRPVGSLFHMNGLKILVRFAQDKSECILPLFFFSRLFSTAGREPSRSSFPRKRLF